MHLILLSANRIFAQTLTQHLVRESHVVDWFELTAGREAVVAQPGYRCLLLDAAADGELARDAMNLLRLRRPEVGCLVFTRGSSVADRVAWLDSGADDCIERPVDLDEVSARIRSVTRRAVDGTGRGEFAQYGPLRVDPRQRCVSWFDRPVTLTHKEFGLLEALLHSRGRILTRARLEDTLYGANAEVASNAVEVHIHHLRRKLARDVVVSVRSVGYRLGPALLND